MQSKFPGNLPFDPELTLLSEGQTAQITGKSVSTLQKERVSGGGIPFVKLGRSVRYRLGDIKVHIAKNVRRSTSDSDGDLA
jgi:hypothetical protein